MPIPLNASGRGLRAGMPIGFLPGDIRNTQRVMRRELALELALRRTPGIPRVKSPGL